MSIFQKAPIPPPGVTPTPTPPVPADTPLVGSTVLYRLPPGTPHAGSIRPAVVVGLSPDGRAACLAVFKGTHEDFILASAQSLLTNMPGSQLPVHPDVVLGFMINQAITTVREARRDDAGSPGTWSLRS